MAEPGRELEATQRWVERVVIGLGLCPFAKAVQVKGQIRYRLSEATSETELLGALEDELMLMTRTDANEVDTTLLVHPRVLGNFHDYNEFLSEADALLERLGLDGVLQIASFHPDYCFADAEPDDPANFTNRSPYPALHLLREASVTRAVDSYPDTATIYERNVAKLRAMPRSLLERLLDEDAKR
jgi:hypothetical protein